MQLNLSASHVRVILEFSCVGLLARFGTSILGVDSNDFCHLLEIRDSAGKIPQEIRDCLSADLLGGLVWGVGKKKN